MKRLAKQLLTVSGIVVLVLALQGCSGSPGISTSVGIHHSPNSGWGHSINVGIHNHGYRW